MTAKGKHVSTERRHLRRDRWLIGAFAALMVASATTLATGLAFAKPPRPDVVDRHVAIGDDRLLSVLFAGDTMLGDGAGPTIKAGGYSAVLQNVRPQVTTADYSIINSESPMTRSTAAARPGAKYSYAADPLTAVALKAAGVDALALNNNHVMDRGAVGLSDTMSAAARAGLAAFGAGANAAEAQRPLLLRSDVGAIAVVNLGENFGPLSRADEAKPGAVVLTPSAVQQAYDRARLAGADRVIAFVHWGDNYAPVNDQQRYWAQALVEAGYDAVIGTGPHIAQSLEFINGVPVFYSLGNFVFGAPGRFATFGQQGFGLTVTVNLGKSVPLSFTVRCLAVNNEDPTVAYKARPCTAAERAQAFSASLPPNASRTGDAAVISGAK